MKHSNEWLELYYAFKLMQTKKQSITIGEFCRKYTTKADTSIRRAFKKIEKEIYLKLNKKYSKVFKNKP
ncbi:hypothetical protein [Photobacterium leiognathi]|uniref:hypothetical protein n=1 Tax=Photobacterium leiognathi TaxID=553611 RepID=UPI00273A54E9|nr:hypothetical protein [Photobacterium leiognathi]